MQGWICRTAGMGLRGVFRRDLDPRLALGLGLNLAMNLAMHQKIVKYFNFIDII